MKKSLLLAAAALLSAATLSAQTLGTVNTTRTKAPFAKVPAMELKQADQQATAVDVNNILGDYTVDASSALSNGGQVSFNMKISLDEGSTTALTVNIAGWDLPATFNKLAGTITLKGGTYLEYNEYNELDVYMYRWRWNEEGTGFDAQSGNFVISVNPTTYELTIHGDEILLIGNSTVGGYFMAVYNCTFARPNQYAMPTEGWTAAGRGEFTDGWILPGYFTNDPASVPYEVALEYHAEENLYRLVQPYGTNSFVAVNNAQTTPEADGYIVFDMSNPGCVCVMPKVFSGMTCARNGQFYCANLEGNLHWDKNAAPEDIIAAADGIDLSSVTDGVITFINLYFGAGDAPAAHYSWSDENDQPIDMIATYTLPEGLGAIGSVATDNVANGTRQYFNLQGMRVANPDNAPGLYIVREGNKSTKVLVK